MNNDQDQAIVTGNFYDKKNTKNPIEKFLLTRFEKSLVQMASAKPFHKVLEIGCGEGNNIPLIKHINPECYYVAADIDEKLLESALRQGADEVFLIDPDKSSKKHLPYKEKTFDLILLIEVLEHLDDNTSDETLAEAARLCSSRCIASVPYEPLWRDEHGPVKIPAKFWQYSRTYPSF